MDTIDTFQRAISILQKDMAKNPAHDGRARRRIGTHGTLAFHFGEKARLAFKPVHVLPGLDHCDFCPGFFVTAVSYGGQDETPNERVTFESPPSVSRADASHQAADIAQQSEQSAFESNPAESKADVTSTTEVENAGGVGQSVFESTPQESAAAVTAADSVPTEQTNVSVCVRGSTEALRDECQVGSGRRWTRFRVHHR